MCGGRARALGSGLAILALLVPLGACGGGGGGDDGDGAGGADAGATCDELRLEPSPAARIAEEPIRIALPRPRSMPLPRLSSRPARSALRAAAGDPRAVGLRILLVTPDEGRASHQAATAALARIGVPHDVLPSADESLERERLYDESGACRYAGVILSHSDLMYDDGTGWVSSFSEEEWALLAEYEQDCAAREVIWYALPSEDLGLTETGSFDGEATETATLTDGGSDRFSYLVRNAAIPIQDVYGYLASVSDPATTVPLLEAAGGGVLAAVHTRPDGTEVLALTLDSGPTSLHSQLVEFGVVEWITRGLFIGKRRIYLAPHIDDVFLRNALWTENGGEAFYRMTAEDVARMRAWTSDLGDRLPAGSSVRLQLAFNGAGSLPTYSPDQSMVAALLDAQREFFWINHTWTHANLDTASQDTVQEEIGRNCGQAEEWGLTHFRCSEAVTPEVTGLGNPDAVAGLLAAGVRHVVSDASKTEAGYPMNPGNNPSPNVGRRNPMDPALLQVPRHPTGIFFSVSTEAEEVGLYNEMYRDDWGRDLTYAEILEADTEIALSYLLAYDVDPFMFHQSNLRFWSESGEWHSLFTDWIDRLVERFTALVDLPVIGLEMSDVASVMQQRDAFDRCAVTATLSADRTRLHIESVGGCVVPITGLDAPDAGDVEQYGGVPTTEVVMPCGGGAIDVDLP
jgi:hypothetical protein